MASARATVPLALGVVSLVAGLYLSAPLLGGVSQGAIPYAYAVRDGRGLQGLVPGDHLQFYAALDGVRRASEGREGWFRDDLQFRVPGEAPRRSYFFLPFSLAFLFAPLLGGALVYNLLLWASFPLTALGGWALARQVGVESVGAAFAGFAVAVLPYRVGNLASGHPAGISLFLLPLTFAFAERAWRRGSGRDALLAGLASLVLALNEPHFFYFLGLLLPLWAASILWRGRSTAEAPAAPWGFAAVAALGPTVAYGVWAQGRIEIGLLALLGTHLLATAGLLALWRVVGEFRRRAGEGPEAWAAEGRALLWWTVLGVYGLRGGFEIPWVGSAAALVAVVAWSATGFAPRARALRHLVSAPETRRLAGLWPMAIGLAAGFAFLWSFKTGAVDASVTAGGRELDEVGLFAPRLSDYWSFAVGVLSREIYPGAVVAGLAAVGLATSGGRVFGAMALLSGAMVLGPKAGLPLYPLAFEVLPFFSMIRQPAKLFALAGVALALAAGFGLARLARDASPRARLLVGAAAAGLLIWDVSYLRPFGLSVLPSTNAAYAAIAVRAQGRSLLELPLWPGDSAYSSIYQYWSTRTGVPTLNGYSPTAPRNYVERVVRPLESMNHGHYDAAQHRRLEELGVRLVTLHRDTFPPQVSAYPYRFTLEAMRQNPNLRPLVHDDGVYLFERSERFEAWTLDVASPLGVFWEAESLRLGAADRRADAKASGGSWVVGRGDGEAALVFGPFRRFPAGRYRAHFRAGGQGRFEIATDRGQRVLGQREWNGELARSAFDFELDAPAVIEARAVAARGEELTLDWVLIERRGTGASTRVEAERLVALTGVDHERAGASGGAVAVLMPEAAPAGSVVRDGPWRLFGPGEIEVEVRTRGGAAELRVESCDGARKVASLRSQARPQWGTTLARGRLTVESVLCTRVVSLGVAAEIDYIEVRGAAAAGAGS